MSEIEETMPTIRHVSENTTVAWDWKPPDWPEHVDPNDTPNDVQRMVEIVQNSDEGAQVVFLDKGMFGVLVGFAVQVWPELTGT